MPIATGDNGTAVHRAVISFDVSSGALPTAGTNGASEDDSLTATVRKGIGSARLGLA